MTRLARTTVIVALMAGLCGVAADAAPAVSPLLGIADTPGAVRKSRETPREVGVAASELLPGNGSRAGYLLGHGNVIPGSEWVFVGLKRAKPNTDYTMDYSSGSLFSVEPVRQADSIKVDYRYSETAASERSVTGPGLMPLKIGLGFQSNLTYSYRAADPLKAGAPDMLTYGLNTTTLLGGSSSITSLMYVTTPQSANRLALTNTAQAQTKANVPQAKRDRLVAQDADLGLGNGVRLKLGFQDVGQDFAGFQTLRESKAAKDDVLAMLEKEKGIERTSIAAEIPTGKDAGLTFSTGRVADEKDGISTQAMDFASTMFTLNYGIREVGKEFSRFKDIRESDRAQMAAEAGTKRASHGLGFVTGSTSPDAPVWSGANVTRIDHETGHLTYRTADIDLGSVKLHSDVREMDSGFNMMTALNDEERTRMALIARRQFDPNSRSSEVVADDKKQINNEAGLNRRNLGVEWSTGPGKVWLGLSNVNSKSGEAVRRDINFEGKGYSLYFNTHRIDDNFDRIAHMQAAEQARFGNEAGMSRAETGGRFKLSFGDLAIGHAGVHDHQGASVLRRSLDFRNTRIKFHANFQDIDPDFSRIMDLSDADRKMMVKERGFRRSDFALNWQATRALNFDTYIYDSTNSTADETRSQNRHRITYEPERGPHVTVLTDDFSYISETGNLSSYSHQKITFDNNLRLLGGILFKGMHDVNASREKDDEPIEAEITQMHFESDQNARTSYTIDTLQKDYGDQRRFEDTWDVGAKTQVAKDLKLTGGFARSAREGDNSEINGRFGFDWNAKKDLSMSFRLANRDGGPKGSQQSKQFSMKGSLFKRFLMFRDVNVDSGVNETQLKGKQVSCDNGLRMDAGLMKGKVTFDSSDKLNPKNGIYHTSRIVQYQSNPDPNKRYHLTFFRQNLITPSGEPARKRNCALDTRVSRSDSFTLTSYFGKDGQNGAVLPVGGTAFKMTHSLSPKLSVFGDYTADVNEATSRRARTIGFGITGALRNDAQFEIYAGWCRLVESGPEDHDRVFRLKYDHKIDAGHYLSLTAEKRSVVEKSSINPFEGETTARVDYKTLFH